MPKPSEKAMARLNQVVEKFKAGDLSAIREVAYISLPPDAPAATWSIRNRILAWSQCGSLDCRTFAHWKRLGRFPIKGSHAVYICEPFPIWKRDKDGSWLMEVGPTGIERHVVSRVMFGYSPRHPYHDTEGEPVEHYEAIEKDPPPLMDVARAMGIRVAYGAGVLIGGQAHVGQDKIELFATDPWVFFHELGHKVHDKLVGLKGGQDEHQEVVAQFTACVLAAIYGHDDLTGETWQYVSSYSSDPIKALEKALGEVTEIVGFIEQLVKEKEIA